MTLFNNVASTTRHVVVGGYKGEEHNATIQ